MVRAGCVAGGAAVLRRFGFRSPLSTLPAGIIVPAFPQRSPPRYLTVAACGGLRSAPDCRTQRALLHLSYSCAPPVLMAVLVSHDPLRTPSVHRSGSESAVCEGTALGSDRFGNSTIAATMAIEDARHSRSILMGRDIAEARGCAAWADEKTRAAFRPPCRA